MGNTPKYEGSGAVIEAEMRAHKIASNNSSDNFAVQLSDKGITDISETDARARWTEMGLDGDFRFKSVKIALETLGINFKIGN